MRKRKPLSEAKAVKRLPTCSCGMGQHVRRLPTCSCERTSTIIEFPRTCEAFGLKMCVAQPGMILKWGPELPGDWKTLSPVCMRVCVCARLCAYACFGVASSSVCGRSPISLLKNSEWGSYSPAS